MNKPLPPLVVPADINLGDIAGVKIGDELAVIHTHTGKREISHKLVVVKEFVKGATGLDLVRGENFVFRRAAGGAARYMAHGGVYFYSANPEHIKEAKGKAETAKRERVTRETERERKMKICLPIGVILGDGSRYDSDGCYYKTQEVAEVLCEKLSDEQLKQLAEWLDVKI